MSPDSKRKYLENFANYLVSKYGSHPDVYGLTGELYVICWKKVKQAFDNKATRESFTDNFKDAKTRALYRLVEHMQHFKSNDDETEYCDVDLNSILKAMLKDASINPELAMYSLLILLTYLSVGRGGEGKFARWEGSFWDAYLKTFVTNWLQTKTLEEGEMPYPSDKELFSCDLYFLFGVFFTLCDGLFRDRNESNKKKMAAKNFIFPALHCYRDEYVAKKISELLTKYSPDAHKSSTSAKSLRIGSNTVLAMHRDITFHMQQARGGWTSGSRSDVYLEICPELTYYAGACLSGWSNCTKIIHPPNLECLGPEVESKLNLFMSHLYIFDPLTMPRFAERGNLRPFLRTVTASILRFHEDFIAEYGASHKLNTKIFHAARKAEVGATDHYISETLMSWSKQIREDFNERNIDVQMDANDKRLLAELVEGISKQNQLIKEVLHTNTLLLKKQDDLNTRLLQTEVVFQASIRNIHQCLDAFEECLKERKTSLASELNSSESKCPHL